MHDEEERRGEALLASILSWAEACPTAVQ